MALLPHTMLSELSERSQLSASHSANFARLRTKFALDLMLPFIDARIVEPATATVGKESSLAKKQFSVSAAILSDRKSRKF